MRLVYITSSHNSAKPIVLKKKILIEIFLTVRLLFSYKLYNQDNKKPNLMSSHQKSYGCHHIFDHPYGRSVTQSIAACLQYEVRITLPSIDFGNQNHNGDVIDREESVLRHSVFRFHLSFKFFLRTLCSISSTVRLIPPVICLYYCYNCCSL